MVTPKPRSSAGPSRRRSCVAAAGLAALAWTSLAGAQPIPGVEVHWAAPASCPSVDDVEARVRRVLGGEAPSSAHTAPLLVDAVVTRGSGRYRLNLSMRRAGRALGAARVIESDSCEGLAGAAAVTIALLARGGSADEATTGPAASSPSTTPSPAAATSSRASPPQTSSPPAGSSSPTASSSPMAASSPTASSPPSGSPPPVASSFPPATPPSSSSPSSSSPSAVASPRPSSPQPRETAAPANPGPPRRWSALLDAPVLVGDEGALPSPALGAGIGLGVRVGRLAVLASAVLWVPQSDGASDLAGYAGHYVRRSGALSGCYAWSFGRFELGPCAGLTLEDVTARGSGPEVASEPASFAWLAVALGARARWSLARWSAVFVRPTVAFETSRPTFAIDGAGALYRVPFATVAIDLGCEWIL